MAITDPLDSPGARHWAVLAGSLLASVAIAVIGWTANERFSSFERQLDSIQQAQTEMAINAATSTAQIVALKETVKIIADSTQDRYRADQAARDFRIRDLILEGINERLEKLEGKVE